MKPHLLKPTFEFYKTFPEYVGKNVYQVSLPRPYSYGSIVIRVTTNKKNKIGTNYSVAYFKNVKRGE